MSCVKILDGRLILAAVVAILVGAINASPAPAQNLRPELALIPADSGAIIHLRPADLWNSELGAALRKQYPRIADDIRFGLEKKAFGIEPAGIESATFVFGSVLAMERIGFLGAKKQKVEEKKPIDKNFDDEKKECDSNLQDGKKDFDEKKGFKDDLDRPRDEGDITIIVTTVKPYDREAILGRKVGDVPPEKHNGKTYHANPRLRVGSCVHFVNDRTCLITLTQQGMKKALDRPVPAKAQGPLAAALELAQKKHHFVIGMNFEEKSAQEMRREIAREWNQPWHRDPVWAFVPLLDMRSAAMAVDVGKNTKLQATLTFADDKQAANSVGAVQDALVLLRLFIVSRAVHHMRADIEFTDIPLDAFFAATLFKQAEAALRSAKVERKDKSVHVSIEAATDAAGLHAQAKAEAAAYEGNSAAREARLRRQSQNNLKQIMLAMHIYHDVHRALAPGAICSKKDGKPLLSWRVAILPYIEYDTLYRQFKLDEPWDSEHNIKLLPNMPKLYAPINVKARPHSTFYRAFTGAGAAFEIRPDDKKLHGANGFRLVEFADGTSNTLGIVEAFESVPWTKPDELIFDAKKALPKVGGGQFAEGFHGGMLDGSVYFFSNRIDEASMRALITRAGGEFVDFSRFTQR